MARPESVDDLPDHIRRSLIARIHTEEFVDDPDITAAYAEFVRAAAGVGDIEHVGSRVDLYRNKPSDDLKNVLQAVQASWDRCQRWYDEIRSGAEPEECEVHILREFAKHEGLPIPPAIEEKLVEELKKELAGK